MSKFNYLLMATCTLMMVYHKREMLIKLKTIIKLFTTGHNSCYKLYLFIL